MSDQAQAQKKYYPSTHTHCGLKIHEVRAHTPAGGTDPIYFASCSILTGKDRWQNVSLKFVNKLRSLAAGFHEDPSTIPEGRLFEAEILDLHFEVNPNPNSAEKPYLNNEGLLSKLSMPWF